MGQTHIAGLEGATDTSPNELPGTTMWLWHCEIYSIAKSGRNVLTNQQKYH